MGCNKESSIFDASISDLDAQAPLFKKKVKPCLKSFKRANFLTLIKKQDTGCGYAL